MQKYTFEEWTKRYSPITHASCDRALSIPAQFIPILFQKNELEDVRYVAKALPESVWTLIDNPTVGGWQIVNGVNTSTQLGYLVTKHPHTNECIKVVVNP